MPTYVAAMHAGEGARSCLTPDSRPPSRSGKNFQRENLRRLAELQEKNAQKKLAEQAARGARRQRRAGSATPTASAPDVLVVSPPSRHCHFAESSAQETRESDLLSEASTPEKEAGSMVAPSTASCRGLSSRGLSSAGGSRGSHWEEQWESKGLERRHIKSRMQDDRRFIDDNRFGSLHAAATPPSCAGVCKEAGADWWQRESRCHFTATGMPYTAIRSPRLSKVRDRDALVKTAEDTQKRAASAVAIRPTSASSSGSGQLVRHTPGQVPDYILQRRERKRQEDQREELLRARRALVPDGFRVVPDSERASAERQTRQLWQQAMGHFMRIPHDTKSPAQVQRRQELEKSIKALEQQLQVLSVDGGGALLVPEGLSLVPTALPCANKETPLTEGQRIKMLQNGPPIM